MSMGQILTQYQMGQIDALSGQVMSIRKIEAKIDKSLKVVSNYLKDKENYGKKRFHGPKQKLNQQDQRLILSQISNSSKSCAQLKRELDLNVTLRTILKVIKD